MPPDLGHLQGKNVMSVEELEADIKQQQFRRYPSGGSGRVGADDRGGPGAMPASQPPKQPAKPVAAPPAANQDEDMSAFKKLVSAHCSNPEIRIQKGRILKLL